MPLPPVYDTVDAIREDLIGEGSRAKLARALLARAVDLRELDGALSRLEAFVKNNGPGQYRSGKELLGAAIHAGLPDDPERGDVIRKVREQWESVEEQRRVIEEWTGPLADHRANLVEAYRRVYSPLRETLAQRVAEARTAITSMHEFEELAAISRAEVRTRFLTDGQSLAEVSAPEVRDEEQLVLASRQLSIPHMRARLAALDREVSLAKTLVLERFAEQLDEQENAPQLAVWDPVPAFSGAQFSSVEEVDMVFDALKDEVKALVRAGKLVRIL